MSGSVNAVGPVTATPIAANSGAAGAPRPTSPTPAPPQVAGDRANLASVARGSAAANVSLDGPAPAPSPVNFARMARGFQAGTNFGTGATGFFGSGFVGGEGRVAALAADRINLAFHVTAPGVDRRETMSFVWQNGAFTARDGARFTAATANGGSTITLTNQANRNQRVEFTSASPGVLNMTSWGFDPAGNGKTIQFTAR